MAAEDYFDPFEYPDEVESGPRKKSHKWNEYKRIRDEVKSNALRAQYSKPDYLWTTANGEILCIPDMELSHLINIKAMMERRHESLARQYGGKTPIRIEAHQPQYTLICHYVMEKSKPARLPFDLLLLLC